MKIRGNTVGNLSPRTDWEQTDPTKADYLKGRDALEMLIQNAQTAADDAQTAADDAQTAADNAQTAADDAQTAADNAQTAADDAQAAADNAQASADDAMATAIMKSVHTTREVTLTAAGWVDNAQTVNVEGVTEDNDVIVSPSADSNEAYSEAAVICTAQGSGTLTFTCKDIPESDVTANVVILYTTGDSGHSSGGNADSTGYATKKWVQDGYQPKGDYLTEVPSGYATEAFVKNKVAEAQLGGGEVDLSGKLDADKLPEAINDALAQAKESGDFTGPQGEDGLSMYYLNDNLEEPDGTGFVQVYAQSLIATNGRELQVGDFVISKNGILGSIYSFRENESADAIIKPLLNLTVDGNAYQVDCVITSNVRPPLLDRNPSFSVASGSLMSVWNKVNKGEHPRVLFRYIGEYEGDVFSYFMECDYIEHFGYGSTPEMLRMSFTGYDEVVALTSSGQIDIANDRITSYTVTSGAGQPGEGEPGTPGFSIYYMDSEVEFPVEGFASHSTNREKLSNSGSGIKVGDLLVSSNGVLCNVTKVSANLVNYEPVAKISSDGKDYVLTDSDKTDIANTVLNLLPTWTGGSY